MSSSAAFAQHAPLIRDYPSAPAPAPAPPDPPEPPQPPKAEPIAFSAVAKASLFGIIGSAISTTTLATITCADSAMTISLSETVAGLTFSYSSGVLSVAGTPTGTTRRQRVMVSYVASDGSNTIRGSTSHDITLVKATEVLTIGSMAGASGKVGRPLTAALASPSANYNVAVTAHASALVPGCAVSLDWTPGATSSGTLTLEGTPTQSGTYVLTVNYRSGGLELGTSTHQVLVAAAYENPAPDPSPGSGPTPIVPSDPGPVTPTPTPGLGPDPFRLQTKVLLHFNELLAGIGYDQASTAVTLAGKNDAPGQNWFNSPHCYQQVNPGLGFMQRFGYSPMAGGFFSLANAGASYMDGIIAGCDGLDEQLTVECFIDIHQVAWDALKASGSDSRFCPVVTYRTDSGHVVWALGLVSQIQMIGAVATREVRPAFYAPLVEAAGKRPNIYALGPAIVERPARFVHLCAMLAPASGGLGFDAHAAAWFNGVPVSASTAAPGDLCLGARRRRDLQGARVRVGGAIAGGPGFASGPAATLVPFCGGVDGVRVTAASRYADRISNSGVFGLLPAHRVIPWPNY